MLPSSASPSPQGAARAMALAANPAIVLVTDAAGVVLLANHGLRGEPADAVVGQSIVELVAPEHAERVRAALGRALHERVPESFDLSVNGPGGPVSAWRVTVGPAGDASEGHEGATFVLTDITAAKREEHRLRRSESLMVDTQGVAHMGTWEWDVSQPTATWSQEMYRIYGLRPEEYVPSYEAYLQMVHPDDRARVMAVTEACFKEHKPYSHDERIFRKGGEMRWLHTWATPVLDDQGRLVRLLGVCQDVTEQKRAESAMRAQMMTRALARRLLHDLIRRAQVPDHVVRELGRAVARERSDSAHSVQMSVDAFEDMGFGLLRSRGVQGTRYDFSATDLLERRESAALPTCALTLGYLEGVVGALTGKPARGNEMRCQSMGHDECRFVVMAQ